MTLSEKIVALSFALFACFAVGIAQNQLVEIQTSASGATLFFAKEPAVLSSEISANKTKITVWLKNTGVADRAREANGKGILENIFAQQGKDKDRDNAAVYAMLKEKSGYSLVVLPYSRAVLLSLIDWQKLPPRDNYYHSGLLALETGIQQAAKEYFAKADQLGQPDAAAIIGLMMIREGRAEEAVGKLLRAMELKTSIADVYAGLSEIFGAQGDLQRAEQFAALFTKKSGRKNFPLILPAGSIESETLTEPRSMAQRLMTEDSRATPEVPTDSASSATPQRSAQAAQDSLIAAIKAKQNAPPTLPDSAKIAKKSPDSLSLLPAWASWATFIIAVGSIVGIFVLAFYFWRWRKRQLAEIQAKPKQISEPSTTSFGEEFQQAFSAASQQKAAELYQKATDIPEEKVADAPPPREEWYEAPQAEEVSEKTNPAEETRENRIVENQEEPFYPNFLADETPESTRRETDFDALAQKLRRGKGELEFAVNILSRQRQETQERAAAAEPEEIPEHAGELSRMAKKLGVGKAELEMKRSISSLSADNDASQEKKEKFASLFGKK